MLYEKSCSKTLKENFVRWHKTTQFTKQNKTNKRQRKLTNVFLNSVSRKASPVS